MVVVSDNYRSNLHWQLESPFPTPTATTTATTTTTTTTTTTITTTYPPLTVKQSRRVS